jgi:hypothetical protein
MRQIILIKLAPNQETGNERKKCGKSRGAAMDTLAKYRDIVKQVIEQYAKLQPSHGDIRLDVVFDEARNRYALMQD